MALNLEETKGIHKHRMERLLNLISGKGKHLAEKTLNQQHKSLSHFPKEYQEIIIREAEIALIDRMILWLNK